MSLLGAMNAVDADTVYARAELSDDALTAAIWASSRFSASFPGWQLYRRVVAGCYLFDRDLLAWAVGCARALARSKLASGRDYLRSDARGPWIAVAAADALCGVIYGHFPAHADARGYVRGVYAGTYRKVRDPLACCMVRGLESFRAELHSQYFQAMKVQMREKAYSMVVEGHSLLRSVRAGAAPLMMGDGNMRTRSEPIHD